MGKHAYLLICFLMVVVLSACGQAGNPDTQSLDVDGDALTSIEPDFVLGTDDQPDCGLGITYTENGFYSSQVTDRIDEELNGWILYYTEYGSDARIPVCSKADCNHQNKDCNAYFDGNTYPMIAPNYMWYYKDNLYIFSVQKDYYAIEKVAKDGSSRSTSCILFRTSAETETSDEGVKMVNMYYPEVILHRGYAYFSTYYPGCEACGLYRVKLDSSTDTELLCSQEGGYPTLYRLKGYGDNVFFEKGVFVDKEGTEVDIDLYAWNLDSEQVIEVASDVVRDYTVGKDCVYYFDLDNLDSVMKYDLKTKQTQMLLDSKGVEANAEAYLFENNGELYYSTGSEQYVFDQSGEQIKTLEGDDMVLLYVPSSAKN